MEEIYEKQLNLIRNIHSTATIDKEVFRIEETTKSPFIFLDPKNGTIIISGRGTPENSVDFIRPILDFIDEKFANTLSIEGHLILTYYSSSFGKQLLDLFKKLEFLYKRNSNVTCYWYYETGDDEILEEGEDYQRMVRIPFVMIEMP
jgi:hypothetical protein